MAMTLYPVNDSLAVKNWSRRMDVEALKGTFYADYISTSDFSLAREMTETKKGAGDSITWGLTALATGEGVTENQTLEGNEESLTTFSDSLIINQLRHGIRVPARGNINDQRVLHDSRESAYMVLKRWMSDRLDTQFFNQLAGNTAQLNTKYLGFNTALGPSTNRWLRAKAIASDQLVAADSTATFVLSLIDKCRNRATTASPPIDPITSLGKDIDYVMFVHPDQVLSLRADATTAGGWFDLQGKRLQGGEGDKNALYTGAIGVYNRTLIVEANRIPQGVHSGTGATLANTRRAVFCGAGALGVAYGKDNSTTKFKWVEKMFDYDNELGVSCNIILGMKKTRYNSEDYGTITVTTYAAPAA